MTADAQFNLTFGVSILLAMLGFSTCVYVMEDAKIRLEEVEQRCPTPVVQR